LDYFEYTYTAVFFRTLNRFPFPDDVVGCVLHQPVLITHQNRPDGYIAYLQDGLPSSPILVSDFKKDDAGYNVALRESLGYYQCIATLVEQCLIK